MPLLTGRKGDSMSFEVIHETEDYYGTGFSKRGLSADDVPCIDALADAFTEAWDPFQSYLTALGAAINQETQTLARRLGVGAAPAQGGGSYVVEREGDIYRLRMLAPRPVFIGGNHQLLADFVGYVGVEQGSSAEFLCGLELSRGAGSIFEERFDTIDAGAMHAVAEKYQPAIARALEQGLEKFK